jgi:hypothetical protein
MAQSHDSSTAKFHPFGTIHPHLACDGIPATSGLEDTAHKAAVALHVLNTLVRNKYKNDPAKLAEWTTASHVEKHTPVPKAKPAPAPTT